jgi:hypothetical protein
MNFNYKCCCCLCVLTKPSCKINGCTHIFTRNNKFSVKLGLDPARPSRKFNEQKEMEDPAVARKELAELKAANRLEKVKEVDEDLEKMKQKRLEERRLREQQ